MAPKSTAVRTTRSSATKTAPARASSRVAKAQLVNLVAFSNKAMFSYGSYTIENRAVPDYRDGLKPVHRLSAWAAYGLGLSPTSKFSKSARTVGETIGKYHPHGDKSCYDAIVNMAGTTAERSTKKQHVWTQRNAIIPIFEGYGNFGDFMDSAAAQRYTEIRLSHFADKLLFDRDYLAVTPMVLNYGGEFKMPLYLPAKLPLMLLNGSESLAVAVRGGCPAFSFDSLLAVLNKALTLRARKATARLTYKDCLSLVPVGTYGGRCVSSDEEFAAFIKTGVGSLKYTPNFDVHSNRTVTISSVCPGIETEAAVTKLMARLSDIDGVRSVTESTGKGKFEITVTCMARQPDAKYKATLDKIKATLTTSKYYSVVITERLSEDEVRFAETTVPDLIDKWLDWRVEFESKVIQYRIDELRKKLARIKLLILAVDSLEIIMASLRQDDSAAYLMKHMKITAEQADMILDLRVRQLKKLERTKLVADGKVLQESIRFNQAMLKTPEKSVLADNKALVEAIRQYVPAECCPA